MLTSKSLTSVVSRQWICCHQLGCLFVSGGRFTHLEVQLGDALLQSLADGCKLICQDDVWDDPIRLDWAPSEDFVKGSLEG